MTKKMDELTCLTILRDILSVGGVKVELKGRGENYKGWEVTLTDEEGGTSVLTLGDVLEATGQGVLIASQVMGTMESEVGEGDE